MLPHQEWINACKTYASAIVPMVKVWQLFWKKMFLTQQIIAPVSPSGAVIRALYWQQVLQSSEQK